MKKILLSLFLLIFFAGCTSTNVSILGEDNLSVNVINGAEAAQDYRFNIARGFYENISNNYKFCRGEATTNGDIIWDGGNGYTFLTSAEKLSIVSDDVDDTFGGAGAWNVFVEGLDNDYNVITEIVNLSGTTPVETQQEFRRTYRAIVINAGNVVAVNSPNEGTITFDSANTSNVQAIIQPEVGQTLMCIYTVPANHTAYITGFSASAPQGRSVIIGYRVRNCQFDTVCAFSNKFSIDLYQSYADGILTTPSAIPEKSDIVFTATTPTGSNEVSASFGYILERDR